MKKSKNLAVNYPQTIVRGSDRSHSVVEYDAYSVVPSVAVLSSGRQIDARLQQSGDFVQPFSLDAIDLTNAAANINQKARKMLNTIKNSQQQVEATASEQPTVESKVS